MVAQSPHRICLPAGLMVLHIPAACCRWLRPRACFEKRSMPLQTSAPVFSIGQFHFNTIGKCAWLAKKYRTIPEFYIYLVAFRSISPPTPHPLAHPSPSPGQHQARQACDLQRAIVPLRHGHVSTPRGRLHIGLVGALADAGKASRTRGRLFRCSDLE